MQISIGPRGAGAQFHLHWASPLGLTIERCCFHFFLFFLYGFCVCFPLVRTLRAISFPFFFLNIKAEQVSFFFLFVLILSSSSSPTPSFLFLVVLMFVSHKYKKERVKEKSWAL